MRYNTVYREDIQEAIRVIPGLSTLRGKSILITGGTGIIGSAAADLLIFLNREYGFDIKPILAGRSEENAQKCFGNALREHEIEFRHYDALRSADLETEADYYIHCAGIACPELYGKYPVETLMGSINGLNAVFQSARRNPQSRVLLVSSSEVYGSRATENQDPFREGDYAYVDILQSRSCYPAGKRAAETLCASYRKEYGTDFAVARPGYVYGPWITEADNRSASAFLRDAASGKPITMKSRGEQKRSYCYSPDCASALLTILTSGASGEAYNIASRKSIASIYEFAKTAAEAGNTEIVRTFPSEEEVKSYTTMQHAVLDPAKLEALGWKGLWSIREGISHTIEAMKDGSGTCD